MICNDKIIYDCDYDYDYHYYTFMHTVWSHVEQGPIQKSYGPEAL